MSNHAWIVVAGLVLFVIALLIMSALAEGHLGR
jgi:uncharacterized membrane protein